MASKKNKPGIDPEQREMIEKARSRAKQKKRLYLHLIFFLIGAVVFIVLNVILEYGQDIRPFGLDWFVWAIIIWGVIFLLHAFNVFVTNKFLGKEWENREIDKLVAKQQKRKAELQKKVEREHPVEEPVKSSRPIETKKPQGPTDPTGPTTPLDPDKPINS